MLVTFLNMQSLTYIIGSATASCASTKKKASLSHAGDFNYADFNFTVQISGLSYLFLFSQICSL